jgi:hypothetical protein
MDEPTQSYRNRLLQLLPRSDFDGLHPHLEVAALEYRQPLFEANQPLRNVYFPVTGVASLVNTMADGSAAEVGTIGNEGIVGLPIILGDQLTPMSALCAGPGQRVALASGDTALGASTQRRHAHCDIVLRPRLLQPSSAVRCLQPLPFPRTAVLPVAADDA